MTYDDIPVRRLSQEEMESMARPWSDVGGRTDSAVIDMFHLYRAAEVALIARPDVQMGQDLAQAAPHLNRVLIRESQLRAAEMGDLNAKMVLAHEFGHVVLHRGPVLKARKVAGNSELRFISEEESAEAQAWKFARALTMPLAVMKGSPTAEALATRCQVPIEQARLRLAEANRLSRKRVSPTFVQPLLQQRKSRAELAEEQRAREAREMLQIWNKAQRIPGDRTNSRLCWRGKWKVTWTQYKQMTECGWFIRDGRIVAWMDLRSE